MPPTKKSWQDGRKILDILSRGPLLPLDVIAIKRLTPLADLNVQDREGNSSLIRAVMNRTCSLRLLSSLLAAGAPISLANFAGSTALAHASGLGRLEFVVMLLSHGADPNFAPRPTSLVPLIETANCEAINAAQSAAVAFALLCAGASTDVSNSLRETPLTSAAKLGREDVVGVLLQACAGLGSSEAVDAYTLPPQIRKSQPSRAAQAYMLLFGVPISRAYVACCRHMLITHSSNDFCTTIAPTAPIPFNISALCCPPIPGHKDLPPPPPLAHRQRVRLLAAACIMFRLICLLALNASQYPSTQHASRNMRRLLLMRVTCARLPYRIALLQSSAVAAGAADAAQAVAIATKTVETMLCELQRQQSMKQKKKRPRTA